MILILSINGFASCNDVMHSSVDECLLHFKDNLRNKLERHLRLPRNVAQEFIADVLGTASILESGLVDAATDDTYSMTMASYCPVFGTLSY